MIFTQFLFPNGRKKANVIDMPEEIEKLADELSKAGYNFEIEVFPDTQLVHMDCCDEEGPLATETCKNGPEVPVKVEKLVRRAHARWKDEAGGKPSEAPRSKTSGEEFFEMYVNSHNLDDLN
jgi:hypothetical protein